MVFVCVWYAHMNMYRSITGTCTSACACTHKCTRLCVHIQEHVHVHVHLHLHAHVCTRICTRSCTRSCTRTRTCNSSTEKLRVPMRTKYVPSTMWRWVATTWLGRTTLAAAICVQRNTNDPLVHFVKWRDKKQKGDGCLSKEKTNTFYWAHVSAFVSVVMRQPTLVWKTKGETDKQTKTQEQRNGWTQPMLFQHPSAFMFETTIRNRCPPRV